MRSVVIGLRLCGIALEPFWPAVNGSSTSRTSVRWRWRISGRSAPARRRRARSRSAARRGGRAGRPGWRPARRPAPAARTRALVPPGRATRRCRPRRRSRPWPPGRTRARSRIGVRWASHREPASFSPNEVGSAWTPCVRPTHSVSACSRARSARTRGQLAGGRDDHLAGPPELERERRVEHVGRGEAEVDPAARRARGGAENVDEGGHVMVRDRLAFLHRLDREGGSADRLEVGVGRPLEGLRRCHLHVAPGGHPGLVGPELAELGAGVAGDHARHRRSSGPADRRRRRCEARSRR